MKLDEGTRVTVKINETNFTEGKCKYFNE